MSKPRASLTNQPPCTSISNISSNQIDPIIQLFRSHEFNVLVSRADLLSNVTSSATGVIGGDQTQGQLNSAYTFQFREGKEKAEEEDGDDDGDEDMEGDGEGGGGGLSVQALKAMEHDLSEYKTYVSKLKFNWVESNIKRRFLSHTLLEDKVVSKTWEDWREAENRHLTARNELKQVKAQIQSSMSELSDEATSLEPQLRSTRKLADHCQRRQKEIEEMEFELSRLRMKRPAEERMTESEAENVLEEQVQSLQSLTQTLTDLQSSVQSLRSEQILKEKKELERLKTERNGLEQMEKQVLMNRQRGGERRRETERLCKLYPVLIKLHSLITGSAPSGGITLSSSNVNDNRIQISCGNWGGSKKNKDKKISFLPSNDYYEYDGEAGGIEPVVDLSQVELSDDIDIEELFGEDGKEGLIPQRDLFIMARELRSSSSFP